MHITSSNHEEVMKDLENIDDINVDELHNRLSDLIENAKIHDFEKEETPILIDMCFSVSLIILT